jgi:hypothetical protein
MDRICAGALTSVAVLLASCANPPPARELPSVPKTPEWLCSVSFDFGEKIDEVYLGTGKTRDAALAAARADCVNRRPTDAQKAVCRTGRPINENCSSPE